MGSAPAVVGVSFMPDDNIVVTLLLMIICFFAGGVLGVIYERLKEERRKWRKR